jgi:hypothetical protein
MEEQYATKKEFEIHIREAEESEYNGFRRLERLEAEVIGDEQSGRKSLRMEFTEEQRKTRSAILVAILLMVVGFAVTFFLTASQHFANGATP